MKYYAQSNVSSQTLKYLHKSGWYLTPDVLAGLPWCLCGSPICPLPSRLMIQNPANFDEHPPLLTLKFLSGSTHRGHNNQPNIHDYDIEVDSHGPFSLGRRHTICWVLGTTTCIQPTDGTLLGVTDIPCTTDIAPSCVQLSWGTLPCTVPSCLQPKEKPHPVYKRHSSAQQEAGEMRLV